jgi:acetylornithine deacetylase/succinyl-diaminopimelate desuccinylase-like protein
MQKRTLGLSVSLASLVLLAGTASPLGAQQLETSRIDALADAQVEPALRSFFEYLSIPNDARFPEDIRKIIDYMDSAFRERGFETTELPTEGSPLLFAERLFTGAKKTVLVYLQSDGQPVDPSRWEQKEPFGPVLKQRTTDGGWTELDSGRLYSGEQRSPDWRVFARSASDSKGPNIQFLAALDAMEAGGFTPDFNIKVIVDTEEELGSPHLPAAVEEHRELLAADMLLIFDGPPHISGRPTLKFGARGIATFTLTTYGPRVPVHSGHYGNYAPNPAMRLARILASMKDEQGRVTIPGFYDGVELEDQTRTILEAVPDDEEFIHHWLGIAAPDEVGGNLQEAVQYPSLNVRGLSSGWVGEESRTIVPANATAEVDVRLVVESDPERLLRLIRDHIEGLGYHVLDREPREDERARFPRLATFTSDISYLAFRTDFDSEPGLWLRRALTHLYGTEPILIRTSGGSIPISPFVTTLGVPAVGVPTVNADNNQHSPNENIRLGNFTEGIRVILAILAQDLES